MPVTVRASQSEDDTAFTIRFWGVRGSVPTPGPETVRYGGNTSCVEVTCGGRRVVIDGGTGLRLLGREMAAEGQVQADILLSHTHLDHIEGFPFFAPAFVPGNQFRIWAGHLLPEATLEQTLGRLMSAPLFPVPLEAFGPQVKYYDFRAGDRLVLSDRILVRTAMLDHPNDAVGYRVEFEGRAVCYISDTSHKPGETNEAIAGLIAGADLVIYDSMFNAQEFAQRPHWGHSTWEEAIRLARLADVKRMALFHHDPARTDDDLDELGRIAAARQPGTFVAREGQTVTV
ncbi:MAG: MBL fold metallo-hydrolase [Alphaproteobacteria bacterium]|nr:MBL fold metallo-hydrolase [Alphaproteobacteria bacterium]MCB9928485.1 MBL fold metallo-hydrolase [Alphaproteobacteria bacterium]